MDIPAWLLVHTISVEAVEGESPYGPTFAAPVDVACNWQGDVRLVRAADGTEVVSNGTAFVALDGPPIPPGSRITSPDGTTYVIATLRHDDAGLGGWQHREVICQ